MSSTASDLASCSALVIDPNPTSRSILGAQLRDLGLTDIRLSGRVVDARRMLETHDFDVVLCEMDFPAGSPSGRELLEDLRRQQMLPLSTVFIMVTGEATYARVAEAAEAALDSYLLKPFNAIALSERLAQARARKRSLHEIFEAIACEDFADAAERCMERFRQRGRYWLYAARIGAELLLRLKRPAEAKELFEAVSQTQALPWARLGIARAQIDGQQSAPALRTLESLIADEPTFADAYDVLGRVQVEQGQLSAALSTYRNAANLTPGSIGRQQKLGMLAFYAGEATEAARALERAVILGQRSRMFDFQSLVLLAFTRFLAKDGKGLTRCQNDIRQALEQAPGSARLRRFSAVIDVLANMRQGQLATVVAEVRRMSGETRTAAFDVEAAANLLSLLAQLTAAELNLPNVEEWVETIGLRFCSSKGISELLSQAASRHKPFSTQLHQCQQRINERVTQAMAHTVEGEPRRSIELLMQHAEQTMNPKFIETAWAVLQRHGAKIDHLPELETRVKRLRSLLSTGAKLPAMGNVGGRAAGGVSLVSAPAAATPAAAA